MYINKQELIFAKQQSLRDIKLYNTRNPSVKFVICLRDKA